MLVKMFLCDSLWLWNQRMKNTLSVSVRVEANTDCGIYSGRHTAHAVSSKGPVNTQTCPPEVAQMQTTHSNFSLLSLLDESWSDSSLAPRHLANRSTRLDQTLPQPQLTIISD